jgi:CRISPR-associated endonuclease Csn1
LLSLQSKDLTDPERMPDKDLQSRLYSATQSATGKEFENALRAFAKRDGPYKGIRRVRLSEALNVIPIYDKEGRAYKGVKGDANARFDVWRLPDSKWVSKWTDRDGVERSGVVSMFNAHQKGKAELKPHPAAKRVLSLRQNDLVAVERDGGAREILRVVKFSSIGSMQLAPHNEAGALKGRDADPADPFKYINTSATGLKNMKARQIRIDELGHIHDPGPRG